MVTATLNRASLSKLGCHPASRHAQNPKAKTINRETFMDVTFVKQLEGSGFIKSLYSGR